MANHNTETSVSTVDAPYINCWRDADSPQGLIRGDLERLL